VSQICIDPSRVPARMQLMHRVVLGRWVAAARVSRGRRGKISPAATMHSLWRGLPVCPPGRRIGPPAPGHADDGGDHEVHLGQGGGVMVPSRRRPPRCADALERRRMLSCCAGVPAGPLDDAGTPPRRLLEGQIDVTAGGRRSPAKRSGKLGRGIECWFQWSGEPGWRSLQGCRSHESLRNVG